MSFGTHRKEKSKSLADIYARKWEIPKHGVFWETTVSDLSTALFDQSIIGHSGSDPGATTFMYFNPETQLGAVILMNSDTHAAEETGLNILLQILGSECTTQMFLP